MPTHWRLGFNLWIPGDTNIQSITRDNFVWILYFCMFYEQRQWQHLFSDCPFKVVTKQNSFERQGQCLPLKEKVVSFVMQFNKESISLWGKIGQIFLQSDFSPIKRHTHRCHLTFVMLPSGNWTQGTRARKMLMSWLLIFLWAINYLSFHKGVIVF